MSAQPSKPIKTAALFAALGDSTRLSLVSTLSQGQPRSIAQLTEDTPITRQAITKHLRVLEDVGLVHSTRKGRELLFELKPDALDDMQAYLERVSQHWDDALARLKRFVESDS